MLRSYNFKKIASFNSDRKKMNLIPNKSFRQPTIIFDAFLYT